MQRLSSPKSALAGATGIKATTARPKQVAKEVLEKLARETIEAAPSETAEDFLPALAVSATAFIIPLDLHRITLKQRFIKLPLINVLVRNKIVNCA